LAKLFPVIVKNLRDFALKKDPVQWNRKIISGANVLLSALEKQSFLVALVIGCNVLNCIKGLTVLLQESSIDITRAMGLVDDTRFQKEYSRRTSSCWEVPRRIDETGTRNGGRSLNQYSHGAAHI